MNRNSHLYRILLILVLWSATAAAEIHYTINVTDTRSHKFSVTADVVGLTPQQNVFIIAAPNAGKWARRAGLVKNLRAFDAAGKRLSIRRISGNSWQLASPTRVARIEYQILDTWHLSGNSQLVPLMAGTTLEREFALLSTKLILGIVNGLEHQPLRVSVKAPAGWHAESALTRIDSYTFEARDFSQLSQSPILVGNIVSERANVSGVDVNAAIYSHSRRVGPDQIFPVIQNVFDSMNHFLGFLPTNNWTVLFIVTDREAGGVEYPDCGVFVVAEKEPEYFRRSLQDLVAHEFFHLILPYSLRTDEFDFSTIFNQGVPRHRWFFEGVTEWASHLMQVRSGHKSVNDFFGRDFRMMLFQNELLGDELSLFDMSIPKGRNLRTDPFGLDYLSVYSRGALAATLLDIHLLHETYGQHGLQDVLKNLLIDYGPNNPLPEERFFHILKDYCGADFDIFIERYVVGSEPMPVSEILGHLGIYYDQQAPDEGVDGRSGLIFSPTPQGVAVLWRDEAHSEHGIERRDLVLSINNETVTPANHRGILERIEDQSNIGDEFEVLLRRDREEQRVHLEVLPPVKWHYLDRRKLSRLEQVRTFEAWSGQK